MKGSIWLAAVAIVLASFPLSMALSKQAVRKGNMAGATMMVGLAFFTVADPKLAAAIEVIENRREIGDFEEDATSDA